MTETLAHRLDRLREDQARHQARGAWAGDFGEEHQQEWELEAAALLPAAIMIIAELEERLKMADAATTALPAWTGGLEPVKRLKDALDLTQPLPERRAPGKVGSLMR